MAEPERCSFHMFGHWRCQKQQGHKDAHVANLDAPPDVPLAGVQREQFEGHYRRLRGSGLSHEAAVKLIEERREFREPVITDFQRGYIQGQRDADEARQQLEDNRQALILKGDALATALSATGRAFAEHQVDGLIEQWEEAKRG